GQGIEDEAISTLFNLYKTEPIQSRFFKSLFNDQSSIAFSSSDDISSERILEMKVFGAIVALMLVYGKDPAPFSPLFLLFLFSGLDIRSLTESFVKEWAPELARDLRILVDAGHQGDISGLNYLFESFCNTSAHVYHNRTLVTHTRLGTEVLYRSIVGMHPSTHPELQAFMDGFKLTTSNGFEFPATISNTYPGSFEAFLSLVSLTKITGYDSIADFTSFHVPGGASFEIALGTTLLSPVPFRFKTFFINFLKGRGSPVPSAWNNAIPHFTPGLPLDQVDEPFFRARMFTWAVTGSPELKTEIQQGRHAINVCFIIYGDGGMSSNTRRMYAQNGQLCIHTCINTILVPSLYFNTVAQNVIGANQGATPDQQAASIVAGLEHWLLVQVLNAIGRHSIV
ncbi:hypothetical protein C8J56DRAFT_789594, partial [Mycena floridula]